MAAVRVLHKQGNDNGCGTEGCNVLQIVEAQINGIVDSQLVNLQSIRALIIEKFDSIEKNSIKESNRIDEIRKGDTEAVRIANDSTVKRAELLSQQLVETAETVRKNADTLATNLATQLQQITIRQDEKIAALERVNWEKTGKEGASPNLQSLVTELINLKNTNEGVTKGQQITKNGLIAIVSVTVGILTILTIIINLL